MEKKYGVALIISCLGLFCSINSVASTKSSIFGGDVKFYGQVVDGACSVRADSRHQIVKMGQVRTNQFKEVGEWVNPTSFKLWLEDCDTTISQSVGTIFTGEISPNDPLTFKAGYGPAASNGIGIGIFDSSGDLVVPGTMPVFYSPLNEGTTVLSYVAKYRSTEMDIKSGDASAQVLFSLIYP